MRKFNNLIKGDSGDDGNYITYGILDIFGFKILLKIILNNFVLITQMKDYKIGVALKKIEKEDTIWSDYGDGYVETNLSRYKKYVIKKLGKL